MALSVFIIISIIISHIFFFQKKKLSFLQNSIVFMVIALVTRNYLTIMSMQLNRLKTTEDDFLFLYFLIEREIITPLLILIFINKYLQTLSWRRKTFLFIGLLSVMHGMNYLSVHFEVIKFVQWNLIYAAIVDIFYLIIGLVIAKIALFLQQRKSRPNDSRL